MHTVATIDEFISLFPEPTKKLLRQMRATIKKAAPNAEEAISYGIPTFKLHGNLVHSSAYKTHIGFYPGAGAVVAFQDKVTGYNCSKGTIQFPIDNPLPLSLVKDIVLFRVMQTMEKEESKRSTKRVKKIQETDIDFMQGLSAPAQRALTNQNITSLQQLSQHTEEQIRSLHGIGPSSIPKLLTALQKAGLSFKDETAKKFKSA